MMKLIQLTCVFIGIFAHAQNTDNLLKNHFNPTLLQGFETNLFYSQVTILNSEFGLHDSKIASIFKLQNRAFQLAYHQYGYEHFKESKYSISSVQKLNTKMNLGLNINFHFLSITEIEKLNSLSFDIGYSYKSDKYEIRLFLENPLNNTYIENDLESRFIISSLYYWNSNLFSEIQFEESINADFKASHQLGYSYKDYLSLSILQSFHPLEYGFRLGYKKDHFQFYSQYRKLTWTNSTGFALIYKMDNE